MISCEHDDILTSFGLWNISILPYVIARRNNRCDVAIRRSESKSSACVHSTLHQAIGRAKLRQDFLPVLDLRAYARLCGEIARASKVLSNKRTLVVLPMRRLSNYLCGAEQKPSEALGNTHTCVLPLPQRPYRRCGLFVCGSSPYRHSERSVGIQRSESKSSACVHSTQIAIYHLRQRRKYQASDIAKLRLEF